ncbi:exodeoxyribonuclease VII small subunit [Pasteurellaceae bacterium HPA106]|uniref:exodeoxyribonuclease VII small subunit n=1 Tax=Spirabiliibacterium pneumoniae TaxID=221400 RepID=UPI001AAE0B1F|nr:exodeoxyribonuclease VII small subunit [Spirabiliibacterium pneumoniae]MBE2896526.1 exodeoxyribonuclease VII small subunit [Spirabiliibacterium pneumoniae]
MAKKATSLDFESTLNELESIVGRLESGELPLEKALIEFEKGVQLAQAGQQRLQQAQQQVSILLEKSAVAPLAPFEEDDNTRKTGNARAQRDDQPASDDDAAF